MAELIYFKFYFSFLKNLPRINISESLMDIYFNFVKYLLVHLVKFDKKISFLTVCKKIKDDFSNGIRCMS